jgi:CheY-like chemotaxis protein
VFENDGQFEYVSLRRLESSSDLFILPVSFCSIYQCQYWMVGFQLTPTRILQTWFIGYGATTQIRKIEASRSGQKSHILALTGMSSLEDKRRAFEAGVDG